MAVTVLSSSSLRVVLAELGSAISVILAVDQPANRQPLSGVAVMVIFPVG